MFPNEAPHERNTGRVVEQDGIHTARPEKFDVPREVAVFADNDAADAELENRSGAHHARAQGRIEGRLVISRPASGLSQAVHLAVGDRIPVLDATVVAGGEDLSLLDQDGANREAAFLIRLQRLGIGELHECVVFGPNGHEKE